MSNVPAVQNPVSLAVSRPMPIYPHDFESAWRMSNAISKSGLAPRGIQTPEAIFTAIQLGAEVGLSPMSALQNIAVVNGRPTIWGDAQLALVRASGLLKDFKETYEGKEGTDDYNAVCFALREGYNNPSIGEFSIADAKQANLWGKEGPWRTNPKRMLKMRARAFALRDGFTDILKGIYATEEYGDVVPVKEQAVLSPVAALNAEFVEVAEPKKRQKKQPEPELTPEQKAVEDLYAKLEQAPRDDRGAIFVEANGLEIIEKAGRTENVDKAFASIGIILPTGEENGTGTNGEAQTPDNG